MGSSFSGFAPESLGFFESLAANNNKVWFEEHRDDFEHCLMEPLKSLVSDLSGAMLVTIPAVDKTISRIYRDIRFSRNKSPYKTCLWITFKRKSPDWKSAPCFFFEISAEVYRFGMGFYCASRETMDNLRRFIEAKPAEFRKATAFFSKQSTFTLEGDRYKRPLNAALPDDLLEWHGRKNIYFMCQRPLDGRIFTQGICDDLREGFELLKPLYELLWRVCG
jgi:uncharacterized protein (TIGR02453 family)